MRISAIFAQAGSSRSNGGCSSCDNDFRGKNDPDYFTGIEEARNEDYRQYDDSTDGLLEAFGS